MRGTRTHRMGIGSAVVAGAVAVLLSGCVGGAEPAASPTVSRTASPTASETPVASPTPTSAAPEPVPTPEGEVPAPPAPPAEWDSAALVGACKVAWNETGQVGRWSDYSADAVLEQRGDAFFVSFPSVSGDAPRDCLVEGTPAEPVVTVAP